MVLSGGNDNVSRLWDAKTGALVATFTGHTAPVLAVTFDKNGDILTASADNTVRRWANPVAPKAATPSIILHPRSSGFAVTAAVIAMASMIGLFGAAAALPSERIS